MISLSVFLLSLSLLLSLFFLLITSETIDNNNNNNNNSIVIDESNAKIACLFLTRGPMPLELIWEEFFSWSETPHLYSIYIHPHAGFSYSKDSLFYGKEVRTSGPVIWGGLSMVYALRAMVAKALLDPYNQWFVLMSESCIPLHPFSVWRKALYESNKSIVNACPQSDAATEIEARWGPKLTKYEFPRKYWRKSATWFALNRKHAEVFVNDKLIEIFDDVMLPDEEYLPTVLASHGLDNETSCNDGFMHHYFTLTGSHPASYGPESINMDLFAYINRAQGGKGFGLECSGRSICHFTARKFPAQSLMKLLTFLDVILHDDDRPYVNTRNPLQKRLRVMYRVANDTTTKDRYYLLMHGVLYAVPSVHAVEAFHLNASTAATLSSDEEKSFPIVNNYFKDVADGMLCKGKHSLQVYFVYKYRKHGIYDWGIYTALGLVNRPIAVMHENEISMIPDGDMIDGHNVDEWKVIVSQFFK